MKVHFLTYATPEFSRQARLLATSALKSGFDSATISGPSDLADTPFWAANRAILTVQRGAGYWLWKPYMIREHLRRLGPDEALLYSDAGRTPYYSFDSRPERLLHRLAETTQGFLLGPPIPHLGRIEEWTKRDCLLLMNANDSRSHPLLMTWGFWRNTPTALSFLEEWLAWCTDIRCLSDEPSTLGPEDPAVFREHRHDQSILSILAHQHKAPRVDLTSTLVHRCITLRPQSALGHTFYKRVQNVEDVLAGAGPGILVREYLRLRRIR